MIAQQQRHANAMATLTLDSSRSSMSDTVCGSEPSTPVIANFPQNDFSQKENKPKKKTAKQQGQQKPQQKKQKHFKADKPFYQQLGEDLLRSTRLHLEPVALPLPAMPPMPMEIANPMSDRTDYFSGSKLAKQNTIYGMQTTSSISLSRKSIESGFSGVTKIIQDEENPSVKYRVKGAVYSLQDFASMATTEDLVLRYGRVAHMGVRDHSYKFWMNSTRSAVVHFKVLNRVAVLGGDPLCHPDRIALTLKEFEIYCKKIGWKVAVVGSSANVATLAKQKGWTCMNFGTERVLNPQTNEVLLGKAGKRIATQCRQLLDPSRGGLSIHTYTPAHGRDHALEDSLKNLYDSWRKERNTSGEAQAFVTVFDLFAMNTFMTFLYTTDKNGQVNGFAALRKLGAVEGYHIDPFIQNTSAPRGTSDLLIYASLAFLNVQGCSYLALGYEPVTELSEIWGLPSIFHSATRKVYKHVFGKIPVGGKEAFHARWKPDETQEASLYLVFVGKIPSPRYMLAMTHFANVSFRKILASDLQEFIAKRERKSVTPSGSDTEVEPDIDISNSNKKVVEAVPPLPDLTKMATIDAKTPRVAVKEIRPRPPMSRAITS